MNMPSTLHELVKVERRSIMSGSPACMGCPHALALKILGKVLGEKAVLVVPAGCTSIISGVYPKASINIPVLHVPFASAAAVASGIAAAYDMVGRDGVVVVWSGDGGAADIGFATLSGAAIRSDNILVVVSDNEAYMNTGIQASSTTSWRARTTTTPILGKTEEKKDLALIMLMHRVPYVATASVGYPTDFAEKLSRAASVRGFRLIHLLSPCPPGWKFNADKTVYMGKLAVETGAWILWEYSEGKFRLSPISRPYADPRRRKPLEEYLKLQGRFSHLKPEDVEFIRRKIENNWRFVLELEKFYS